MAMSGERRMASEAFPDSSIMMPNKRSRMSVSASPSERNASLSLNLRLSLDDGLAAHEGVHAQDEVSGGPVALPGQTFSAGDNGHCKPVVQTSCTFAETAKMEGEGSNRVRPQLGVAGGRDGLAGGGERSEGGASGGAAMDEKEDAETFATSTGEVDLPVALYKAVDGAAGCEGGQCSCGRGDAWENGDAFTQCRHFEHHHHRHHHHQDQLQEQQMDTASSLSPKHTRQGPCSSCCSGKHQSRGHLCADMAGCANLALDAELSPHAGMAREGDVAANEMLDLDEREGFDESMYPPYLGPVRPENGAPFCPMGAPHPSNEAFRLQVLRRYNVLDTDPDPRFDRITALACKMFHAPVSLVSLVDEQRQWFKSNQGLPGVCQTDRNVSFCAFTLLPSKNPCLVVKDATKDTRFVDNALVTGPPHIRFYAGAPLVTSRGFILGSICVIDFKPHDEFSAEQQDLLMALASLVTLEIEKHTQEMELQRLQAERFEEDKRGLLMAIDAFSEGLVMLDVSAAEHPIVFVNQGWEQITGYAIEDVVGLNMQSILNGPLTDQSALDNMAMILSGGGSVSVELLHYRRDGTPFWNWMRIRPVPATSSFLPTENSQRYYFGTMSDCTARKEKELQLEALKMAQLEKEASTKAKRQFVANISHEIRTPMNAIIACSMLLQDAPNLTSDQQELVQMISGSGQQLLSLIGNILDFSKMEAGKLDVVMGDCNLWQCLDFCMEMLVLKSQEKGLDLSYSVHPSVPQWIWTDQVRLSQIITNLLSNAAKFTEEGGEVELSVKVLTKLPALGFDPPTSAERGLALEQEEEGKAGAWDKSSASYELQFSVRDTGIGMPKEFAEVIFEAFTQCDNSRTKKHEGTGLGMAISKDLVERLGGRIWVESQLGQGSTFHFTIKAHGSTQSVKGKQSIRTDAELSALLPLLAGKRALLVGGKDTFHRMMESVLGSFGVRCEVARTREELESKLHHGERARGSIEEESLEEPDRRCGNDKQGPVGMDGKGVGRHGDVSVGEVLGGSSALLGPKWLTSSQSFGERHKPEDGGSNVAAGLEMAEKRRAPSTAAGSDTVTGLMRRKGRLFEKVKQGEGFLRPESSASPAFPDEGRRGMYVAGGRHFDLVFVDCPLIGRRSTTAGDSAKLEKQKQEAEQLMLLGCSCGDSLPTFLLLPKHWQMQTTIDPAKLDNVTVLSRPIKVKQVLRKLTEKLTRHEQELEPTAAVQTTPTSPPTSALQRSTDCSLRVLVAEDNQVNQKVLLKLLKGLGLPSCTTASNGLQVLGHLQKSSFDVIFMDVQMPEMDGLTATRQIRDTLDNEKQPIVVALTADVGPGIESECLDAGMNWYISKPIHKGDLEKVLDMCWAAKRNKAWHSPRAWLVSP